jgi:hypothetical protein
LLKKDWYVVLNPSFESVVILLTGATCTVVNAFFYYFLWNVAIDFVYDPR